MKALEILRLYKNNIKLYEESKYNFFLLATSLALALNRYLQPSASIRCELPAPFLIEMSSKPLHTSRKFYSIPSSRVTQIQI